MYNNEIQEEIIEYIVTEQNGTAFEANFTKYLNKPGTIVKGVSIQYMSLVLEDYTTISVDVKRANGMWNDKGNRTNTILIQNPERIFEINNQTLYQYSYNKNSADKMYDMLGEDDTIEFSIINQNTSEKLQLNTLTIVFDLYITVK